MAKSPKSRRWIVVVNNYTPQDEQTLQSIPCRYIVCGKEAGANGTPQLQGFVIFNSTKTLVALKKLHATAHFEPANKTSETNANYCKKGEQPKEEWDEHHDDGPNFGLNYEGYENGDFPSNAGQRTDLDEIKEAIEDGMTNPRDLRKQHSNAYSNHRRFVAEYIVDNKPFVELKPHPQANHASNVVRQPPPPASPLSSRQAVTIPPSPSSDWRSHTMSPSPMSKVKGEGTWPGLSDFPAPPKMGNNDFPAPPTVGNNDFPAPPSMGKPRTAIKPVKPLRGAWATRK